MSTSSSTPQRRILLDNCPTHVNIGKHPNFRKFLVVLFFRKNLINKQKPHDMDPIFGIKCGYKMMMMLTELPDLMDDTEKYPSACKIGGTKPKGKRGLVYRQSRMSLMPCESRNSRGLRVNNARGNR